MEHVPKIWLWVKEMKRILKDDGKIIIISPVSWIYHEAPVDCWRIYPDGMKALLEEEALKAEVCEFTSLEKDLLPKGVPTIPGVSAFPPNGQMKRDISGKLKMLAFYNRIMNIIPGGQKLRVPRTVAYDNICIASKMEYENA